MQQRRKVQRSGFVVVVVVVIKSFMKKNLKKRNEKPTFPISTTMYALCTQFVLASGMRSLMISSALCISLGDKNSCVKKQAEPIERAASDARSTSTERDTAAHVASAQTISNLCCAANTVRPTSNATFRVSDFVVNLTRAVRTQTQVSECIEQMSESNLRHQSQLF